MKKLRGVLLLALALGVSTAVFAACQEKVCEHEYDNACDAVCNLCGEERETPDHMYDNVCDATCNVCGETRTPPHDYTAANKDDDNHWIECSVCGAVKTDSVVAHTYTVFDKDGDNHWKKCKCGAIDEATVTGHVYNKWQNAGDEHHAACECGAVDTSTVGPHEYTQPNNDGTNHWNECECGAIDVSTVVGHEYTKPNNDENKHWNECECGYVNETDKIGHTYTVARNDENKHWNECECGYVNETDKIEHTYTVAKHDGNKHWDECECGYVKETDKIDHTYTVSNHDENKHWNECQCGYVAEEDKDAHNTNAPNHDGTNHWNECSVCGYVAEEDKDAHDYTVWKTEGNQHWKECECGAEQPDSRAAHSYTISGGELVCECGQEGSISSLSQDDSEYAYADLSATEFAFTYKGISAITSEYIIVDENGNAITKATEAGEYTLYAVKSDSSVAYSFTGLIATKVIMTAEDMNGLMRESVSSEDDAGYYILGSDINFNTLTLSKGLASSNTADLNAWIGSGSGGAFTGTFDGRGHTIQNYQQTNGSGKVQSLFGKMVGATVKNVKFTDVMINGWDYGSLFATYMYNSQIVDVEITRINIYTTSGNSGLFIGRQMNDSTFTNVTVTLGSVNSVGACAIFGGSTGTPSTLTAGTFIGVNFYNVNNILYISRGNTNNEDVYETCTGLTLYTDNGETEYPFKVIQETVTTEFFADSVKGGTIAHTMFVAGQSYTVNGNSYQATENGKLTIPFTDLSDGTNVLDVLVGDGTTRVPVVVSFTQVIVVTKIITTAEEMNALMFTAKSTGDMADNITGYYVLGNDIDFAGKTLPDAGDATSGWHGESTTILGFAGTFNGNGYTIKNYAQPQVAKAESLFGKMTNATVKNVVFEKVVLNPYGYSALFATYAYKSTIENITITGLSFTKDSAGQPNGILIGRHMADVTFTDVHIELGSTGYFDALIGGTTGYTYAVTAATFTNVNVYNVKTVNKIAKGKSESNATLYATCTGLKIYTNEYSEGGTNTEYSFS